MNELKNNQYAVLVADGATGQVFNIDGQISLDENEEIFLIFESLDEAHSFIKAMNVKNDSIEFSIYDSKQEMIYYQRASRYASFGSGFK